MGKQNKMSALDVFLRQRKSLSEEVVLWGNGTLPLRSRVYLAAQQPPAQYVTSVRALVFRHDSLVVVRDPTGFHIIPGGRRENGETLDATLQREVLEETGWTLTRWSLLGFMHFHHLAPKPEGYPYPYPDFLHLIYVAEADRYVPSAQVFSPWELEVMLYPIADVQSLDLASGQLRLLEAALKSRKLTISQS